MGAQKKKKMSVGVAAAIASGGLALVGGVLVAVINGMFATASPPTTPTTESTKPTCEKKARIDKPAPGARIDGAKGTDVAGSVCDLRSGEAVWIFEYDGSDKNYYLVYDPNVGPRPVTDTNGNFTIFDGPIGDPGDQNKQYTFIAAVGTGRCQDVIESQQPDDDDNYVFRSIPAGCKEADRVQVLESQR